jgi:hypothetical protein
MRRREIADNINKDPRGRTETEWLDTLDYLVARLSAATSAYIEVGRYWINDFPDHGGASLTARVRSKKPLPGVDSDYWEAAVCLSGAHRSAWSDAYVIPYLKGSRVTSKGRLVDCSTEGAEEFCWFKFAGNDFEPKGWTFPEGPGEWLWVEKPGDEYQQIVNCHQLALKVDVEAPIYIDCVVPEIASIKNYRRRSRPSTPRMSLLHVNRNREHTNLVPWNASPPRPTSQDVVTLNDVQSIGRDVLRLDLRLLRIRGGWIPGNYHLSMRVQNFHKEDDWSWSSEISAPLKFEIE